MPSVLLDTSALFASLDVDDPNHSRARDFLTSQRATYVVAETVFSEAMTLIKLHLGVTLAVETGKAVLAGWTGRWRGPRWVCISARSPRSRGSSCALNRT